MHCYLATLAGAVNDQLRHWVLSAACSRKAAAALVVEQLYLPRHCSVLPCGLPLLMHCMSAFQDEDNSVENDSDEDDSELDTSSEDFEEEEDDSEAGAAPDDAIQAAEPGSLLERIQQASKKQQKVSCVLPDMQAAMCS